MPTNKLNDAKCRAFRPTGKAQKIFDGNGLHLWISPAGAKVWRLAYRLNGKPKTLSIGPYPEVSLSAAREKCAEVRATLRDGSDPMAPRRKGITFAEASERYWSGRKDLSASYLANATRAIEQHLAPALGDRPVGSITRLDLLTELQKMDARGHHVYVRKVRMWASQVFEWAVEHEHCEINPAALIRPERAFGKTTVTHMASVSLAEVPALMDRLALEDRIQSVLACYLLALTWARTGELRMMEWTEISGDLWTIPAGKMKRRREHVVPLSRQALTLLDELKARARGRYVFPNDRRQDRPMSENAVLYLLHRIGYKGKMTGHGFRSVASTWANERGYPADAIERQLAHAPDDKIRAAYNRAEYLTERRQMLQGWSDWLLPNAELRKE